MLYVYGSGAIWKFNRKQMQRLVDSGDLDRWGEIGTELSSPKLNWRTGRWRKLPSALWASESGELSSVRRGVECLHFDHLDLDEVAALLSAPLLRPALQEVAAKAEGEARAAR